MNRFSSPRALVLRIGLVATLLILALVGLLVREDRARAGGQEVRFWVGSKRITVSDVTEPLS